MHSLCRYVPLVGRILLGGFFLVAGINKIVTTGVADFTDTVAAVGGPLPEVSALVVIGLELVAGAFLIVGFQTKWAALSLVAFLVLTLVYVHPDLTESAAMKNLALIGALLFMAGMGAGPVALDSRAKPQPSSDPESLS